MFYIMALAEQFMASPRCFWWCPANTTHQQFHHLYLSLNILSTDWTGLD